jgi:hypothetical protein
MKWSELRQIDECEELNSAIDQQKQTFKEIINAKDKLIKEFWDELKKKEDQYVKMLND